LILLLAAVFCDLAKLLVKPYHGLQAPPHAAPPV